MITVTGKVIGRRKPLFADWSIPLPPDLRGEGTTLRDIITRLVHTEVSAFKERQEERRVFRALTAHDIERGLEKGKVEMGGSDVPIQPIDDDSAVATALQAFEDGLYLVVIDETEHKNLDSQIFLQPDSRIAFVRLTWSSSGKRAFEASADRRGSLRNKGPLGPESPVGRVDQFL
jgi:hypothetical protein